MNKVSTRLMKAYVGFVFLFLLAPFIVILVSSFAGGKSELVKFPPDSSSIDWYLRIPPKYLSTFLDSVLLGTATAIFSLLIGVPASLGIVRSQFRGKEFLASLLRAPVQVPYVVTGVVFLQYYYAFSGFLDIKLFGSFTGLLCAHVLIATPYLMATVVAVLQKFNSALEEAALNLGATKIRTFFRITLQVIKPGIFSGIIYAFVISFGNVPVSLFLVGSGFNTLPVEIFYALEFDYNPSILALSSLVVVFSVVLIWLMQKYAGLSVFIKGYSEKGRER